MQLQIFDVEHGACALLTADNGARMLIDCGHNASTGWKPGTYLREQGVASLEMLAITNYDEDHVSGANDLFDKLNVQWLLRNVSVSASTIKMLKSEDGMGPGIERLVNVLQTTFNAPPAPISTPRPTFTGLEWQIFNNAYPTFDDENNLSMAVFLKCHGIGVLFTGDLEAEGFRRLMIDSPAFRQALLETHVLVAPHHGREGGCCEDALPFLPNVNYVVISDKGYQHDTQRTIPFYTKIAKGGPYGSQGTRYVLTTRNDGEIVFRFNAQGWSPVVKETPMRRWI